MKKIISLTFVILFGLFLVACSISTVENTASSKIEKNDTDSNEQAEKYETALEYIENKNYTEAYALLEELGEYEDAEEILSRFHYVYDKGEITINGIVDQSSTIVHNEDNLPVKQISEKNNGTTVYDYSYDNNGNIIKEIKTAPDGTKTVYDKSYDDNGNKIKEVKTNPDGTKEITECTYDEKDNLIKKVVISADGSKNEEEYVYDDNGNIIKKTYTEADGTVTSYDYTCKLVYIPYDVSTVYAEARKEP